ncbi:MAG: AAA family ATPase [Pirellulales bacterium]|nr:AAA family ATPase [Pirellulales bacterium]
MAETVNMGSGRTWNSPLVVELVGLAGTGKTTLARALQRRGAGFRVAPDISMRNRRHVALCLAHFPKLAPLLARQGRSLARFAWDDLKAMVYLTAWPRVLRGRGGDATAAVLLDHGPVFKLATLRAFGPDALRQPSFGPWWNRTFEQWASTLDVIVRLGAPEDVLIQRINGRNQRHPVKGKPEIEAHRFLARYQASYEEILAQLCAHGPPMLLDFDTGQTPAEQIAEEIVAACRRLRGRHGRLAESYCPEPSVVMGR